MVEVMRGVFIARCNPLSGVARGEGRTWEGKNLSHLARPDLRRFERPAPSAVYSSRSGWARRRGAAAARVCMADSRSQRVKVKLISLRFRGQNQHDMYGANWR